MIFNIYFKIGDINGIFTYLLSRLYHNVQKLSVYKHGLIMDKFSVLNEKMLIFI